MIDTAPEEAADVIADHLAVYKLEPVPSKSTRAIARHIVRSLCAMGFTISKGVTP